MLSAHPLEKETQNKHLQCVWMLWNVRMELESQESALPSPCGESGLEGEFSYGFWESCMAECIIAILSSPYVAAQQHWAQLVLLPPTSFFSLFLSPPTSPAALLSLPEPQTSECTRAQSLPLHLHLTPRRIRPVSQLSIAAMRPRLPNLHLHTL